MADILPFLKSLISSSGLSGYETPVAKLIAEKWRPLVDETHISRVGSLHGLKKGSGESPRPALMIATHMDAIGMQVTRIVDGFLHITSIGGIDIRVLPGAQVTVHASGSDEELPAVVVMPPARFLPESAGEGFPDISYLLVDTGLLPREVVKKVRVGDLVSFANEPIELAGDIISGHTVDNRASVAALTICLEELQNKPHVWDVWAVATVQEETNYLGAYSSAFEIRPCKGSRRGRLADVPHGEGSWSGDRCEHASLSAYQAQGTGRKTRDSLVPGCDANPFRYRCVCRPDHC
jgi:tetrahedral aminopeptidase